MLLFYLYSLIQGSISIEAGPMAANLAPYYYYPPQNQLYPPQYQGGGYYPYYGAPPPPPAGYYGGRGEYPSYGQMPPPMYPSAAVLGEELSKPPSMRIAGSFVGVSPPTLMPDPDAESSRLLQESKLNADHTPNASTNQGDSAPANSSHYLREGQLFHAFTTTTPAPTSPPVSPSAFEVSLREAMLKASTAFDKVRQAAAPPAVFAEQPEQVHEEPPPEWKKLINGAQLRSQAVPDWRDLLGMQQKSASDFDLPKFD